MFIGRKEELKLLEDCYAKNDGQFIILYGRRRIGKTETLRKFSEGKDHIFYSCTESLDEQQLNSFSERVLQKGIPAAKYIQRFSGWAKAIESILELPYEGKKLLIIDEFPYLVKGNPAILSILQNLWDEKLRNENVMIILCGSAMSFIEKEMLSEKTPLYGRATAILKMKVLAFYDAIQFFPNYTAAEKIIAYAILGGIPHYLKQFDNHSSLEENIRRQILTRGSILYSEVEFLMRQELRETATYNVIIEAVAMGNTKMNEIFQKTQIEKNKLSVYLKNLINLRLIQREFSVVDGIKEQPNIQRGLYQVTDNFFRFWYAFIFPNLSELESGDVEGIWEYVVKPELNHYTSRIFEDICREYLRNENRKNNLPFHFTKIGRWWNKQEKIDVFATDQRRENFLIGECKYKNSLVTVSDIFKMKAKFEISRKNNKVYYYLFSKAGFTEDAISLGREQNIQMLTAKEIVEE